MVTRPTARGLIGRISDAFNELRTLMLGSQILLGFHFHAALQPRFADLAPPLQGLALAGLMLILTTFALLAAPAPVHQLLERGGSTARQLRVATLAMEAALWPFAAALGLDLFLAAQQALPAWAALPLAAVAVAGALWCWQSWRALARAHVEGAETMAKAWLDPGAAEPTSLQQKITQLLTEARVILPGAQALLGFQFTATLTERYARLPALSRDVHLAALIALALAIILLMAPAPYHRVVAGGDARPDVDRFGVRTVLAALVPLGLGLAGDIYVVAALVIRPAWIAAALAAIVFALLMALWFGLPLWLARRQPVTPSPPP